MRKNNYPPQTLLIAILAVLFSVALKPEESVAQTTPTISAYLTHLLRIQYPISILYRLPARDLNGIHLNKALPDGRYIEKISLDHVRMHKWRYRSLYLDGTRFLTRHHVRGLVFKAILDDGSTLPVRIDDVDYQWSEHRWQIDSYYASYKSKRGWKPLCGVDENGDPVGAIPLLGYWDYSEGTSTGGSKTEHHRYFTFACNGYVIQKCVEAGYKPWEHVNACYTDGHCEQVSLSAYHQTCTRMLRADFCGDGVSYTEDDLMVGLYDGMDIRYDSEEWKMEAEWDENGAICATGARVWNQEPTCLPYLEDDTCGEKSHFADGVLIMSETPPE